MKRDSKWFKSSDIATLAIAAGIALLMKALGLRVCLIHRLFGIRCMGCGGTQALVELMRGNLANSWNYNPKVILLLLFILLTFIWKKAFHINEL